MIKIESSENIEHPWANKLEQEAEQIFTKRYPAIYKHFEQFRTQLIARSDQGRFFWELRSCKYWQEFEQPKIIIPAITNNVEYAPDSLGYYSNDKTSICIPKDINYTSGILNSAGLLGLRG